MADMCRIPETGTKSPHTATRIILLRNISAEFPLCMSEYSESVDSDFAGGVIAVWREPGKRYLNESRPAVPLCSEEWMSMQIK